MDRFGDGGSGNGVLKSPFGGGCSCGAIRFECRSAPLRMVNCHCRDCQLAGGSAYSPTVIVRSTELNILTGKTRRFEKIADSGNIAIREFCPNCGTPLFASSSAHPEHVGIRASVLDDPAAYEPEANVWVKSAQPWTCMATDLPRFATNRRDSTGKHRVDS